jgi:hypothetical protein
MVTCSYRILCSKDLFLIIDCMKTRYIIKLGFNMGL